MDFTNHRIWPLFTIKGHTVYITESIFATWIIMAVLFIFTIAARYKINSFKERPAAGSIQNLLELAVESMHNMAESNLGKRLSWLGGYFFGVFAFILACNYSSLFKLRPPTTDFATTLALALNTFFLIHVLGLVYRKGEYLKDYFKPIFVFLPTNIIGELSRPVSLSFRLFGNILGGFIMLELLYASLPAVFRIAIPDIFHFYEDIFIGALQAFIFCVLSMTFIKEKASEEEA